MTGSHNPPPEIKLMFTEDEWNTSKPKLTRDMTEHLRQYRTPVFKDRGDYGEGWGSGSFVELDGAKYILTNEHVATVRCSGEKLGFRFNDQDRLARIQGNHVEKTWPWDLALLPVNKETWVGIEHTSKAIQIGQIALAHTPIQTEVFAFTGFAGERTAFHFSTLLFEATTSLAREVDLPADDERWDGRFHFGLDYLPDAATSVLGNKGLPKPPGLSGSTVWNTCFVEAKANGINWTPDLARVVGVVWGWSSSNGLIVATRAEHVRSFLLGGPPELNAKRSKASAP